MGRVLKSAQRHHRPEHYILVFGPKRFEERLNLHVVVWLKPNKPERGLLSLTGVWPGKPGNPFFDLSMNAHRLGTAPIESMQAMAT